MNSNNRKKIAIIGASYLQLPLIERAKQLGYETHAFAWAANDVGETAADHFYPISITEKEEILDKCAEIGIDAVCSISSDLAAITVNYVAEKLGLTGNSSECVLLTTNKYAMRKCFAENGDPSPRFVCVEDLSDTKDLMLEFPVIVKPLDRSGSRGITKVYDRSGLKDALEAAFNVGFIKKALIEEYVEGIEYSVEYNSWKGVHTFLALTRKYTTGSPNYIETGHLEPADVDDATLARVKSIVSHALDSLKVQYGASHSEIKISTSGEIRIIEIGARMGGDNIGSSLVELSTGYPYVDAVIDTALGKEPDYKVSTGRTAGIRFVLTEEDLEVLKRIKAEHPEIIVEEDVREISSDTVTDSASRFGFYTISSDDFNLIRSYMPQEES